MALYVKFAQQERPKTVRQFIRKYYSNHVDPYLAKGHDTYFDPECKRIHCTRMYRSFDDLLDLVNTYYPSIKPLKLMHYLLTTKIPLQGINRFAKPHLGTCNGMGRIRFIPYNQHSLDGFKTRMPNSKYTWEELLTPLGITNHAEFEAYIQNQK